MTGASSGSDADGVIPDKHRSAVETIVAVTGASEDEAFFVLKSCNYDVDETTNKLLDSPFETFTSKAKKKSEAKKSQPKPTMVEPKRPVTGGRDYGSRDRRNDGSRGGGQHHALRNIPPSCELFSLINAVTSIYWIHY
eukprot:5771144-Pyramimonas_sp.AAC.2